MGVKVNTKEVQRLFEEMLDLPKEIMATSGKYFKSITPIDKGNARRNTSTRNLTIKANYGYANDLNNGTSRQAPDGMSDPTVDFINKEFAQEIKRL